MFEYKKPYYLFAFAALIGFGLQGIVSNTGALTVVFPNLPFPVPYINGRTFHANIGMYWTLLGLLGGVFYFYRDFIERAGMTKLINILFWGFASLMVALQGSLILRFPVGREYMEGPWFFRAALVLPLMLLVYCLSRIYKGQNIPARGTASLCILAGSILLLFSYLTTVIFYQYQPLEQLSQFLVFHAFGEMGAELIAFSLICFLIAEITGIDHAFTEQAMFLSLVLAGSVASLAILEYFIWPGEFLALLLLSVTFSGLHVLPLLTLLYITIRQACLQDIIQSGRRNLLALLLLTGTAFYHMLAAGMLGLFLAYPSIYYYLHGGYAPSAHSHQALFGVFGSLAIALAIYILFEKVEMSATDLKVMVFGVVTFNGGLLIMGLMLLAAGGLQAYLVKIIGVDEFALSKLLRPYLFTRIIGGILYTIGNLTFCWMAGRRLWVHRRVFTGISDQEREAYLVIQKDYTRLIGHQKEVKAQLAKIMQIYRALFPSKRGR